MADYRKLTVWQKSHALTLEVYHATRGFPREELYGLTSQMRRACVSIPSNIAEGCGRGARPDFARFLSIAAGSACELEYQLLLARDLGLLDAKIHQRIAASVIEVRRMLTALIQKVNAEKRPATPRCRPTRAGIVVEPHDGQP
jgi:four helix bundle protein